MIVERGNKNHYFQLIATGVAGDHGDLVQRHAVRVPGIVIGQQMGHIMVDVPAQDLQATHNHATHIAAQLQVSKMSLLSWGKHPVKDASSSCVSCCFCSPV